MAVYDAKTSQKGQATIPLEVRKVIGLTPGGTVQFVTTPDGDVRLVARKNSLRHLKGLFGPLAAPIDIDEAMAETVARRTDPNRTDPDP
jgi:bifunctional DNA-binding transcriptional regulator/antitoxin component of YhaV-PrlF toxin-antitoxin module